MARKKEKIDPRAIMTARIREELNFCGEPTYKFNIGDKVSIGNLVDPIIEESLYDGKAYIVSYKIKSTRWGETTYTDGENAFAWYNIRPLRTEEKHGLVENEDVFIIFSNQSLETQIHKVMFFGVDFTPSYQRDLVWTDRDRELLLDSVFQNIDIGKFVFVDKEFERNAPAYEILDGKQRLSALTDYFCNRYTYRGLFYNDLHKSEQDWFCNRMVSVGNVRNITEKQKLKLFIMLNTTGRAVDEEHLNRIKKMYQEA